MFLYLQVIFKPAEILGSVLNLVVSEPVVYLPFAFKPGNDFISPRENDFALTILQSEKNGLFDPEKLNIGFFQQVESYSLYIN